MTEQPLTTVVVIPRERFSVARRSLTSILENTPEPRRLIYVDCNAPPDLATWVQDQAHEHGFEVVRTERFLMPNEARNLVLEKLETEFVVFIDNDVVVEPGWLGALERRAQETGAAAVGPATLVGEPTDRKIHLLGGELTWEGRRLRESHRFMHETFGADSAHAVACPCDFSEFHCILLRVSALRQLGTFDEELRNVAEHVDLALRLQSIAGVTWYEPDALVAYLMSPVQIQDVDFFRFRWGQREASTGLQHLMNKWDLAPDSPIYIEKRWYARFHRGLLPIPNASKIRASSVYAETPPALYRQFIETNPDPRELVALRDAVNIAITRFSGLWRPSGRPFLCHAIGTASVLLAHGAPLSLAVAGLLHATYTHGLLDADASACTPEHRTAVRAKVGSRCEQIVWTYTQLDTGAATNQDPNGEQSCIAAAAWLIRIANDIDMCRSGEIAFSGKSIHVRPDVDRLANAWAATLGLPALYEELETARKAALQERTALPTNVFDERGASYAIRATEPSAASSDLPTAKPRRRARKTLQGRMRDELRRIRRRIRRESRAG